MAGGKAGQSGRPLKMNTKRGRTAARLPPDLSRTAWFARLGAGTATGIENVHEEFPITVETTLPPQHPLAEQEELIDQLRDCGRLFHQRGWSVGTSSNYSVVAERDPTELIVTASGRDKGRLERQDFVRIGCDGRPTVEGQPKSSAETMLHVVLAELPDVGCILHTHSIWGTLLSDYFFCRRACADRGIRNAQGSGGDHNPRNRSRSPNF